VEGEEEAIMEYEEAEVGHVTEVEEDVLSRSVCVS